jgi:tetratricopeptide (TPR) repeat protein
MQLVRILGYIVFVSILCLITCFDFLHDRESRWRLPYEAGLQAIADGRMGDAVKRLEAAVRAAETLGGHDQGVGICVSALARAYSKQGRDAEAMPLLLRALAIFEEAIGPDHPEVALCLGRTAILDFKRGLYADAEHRFRKAVIVLREEIPVDHLEVAEVLDQYSLLLRNTDRPDEANAMAIRSREIRERRRNSVE